ncbi:MAG: sensor histidine kinase [Candidatus Longimicrobiales bacterium M2_2A_002]
MMGVAVAALAGALVGALLAGARGLRRARRRERELEETRRRLAAAEEARDRFFDRAAHELRAPLSAIFGYQELLQDGAYGELTPDAADAVERIGRAGHHLLHLTDGIIELGRLRAGDLRPEMETVDLGMILASAADTFRTQAAERGITPTVELPDTMPRIRSDHDRLVRALDLAITSAIRHPAGGAMTLRVALEDGLAILRIGPTEIEVGPDPDDAAGTGIRLAMVRGIAELLDGGLELPGEGGHVREIVLRIAAPPAPSQGL